MTNDHFNKENKWFYYIQVVMDIVLVNFGLYSAFTYQLNGDLFIGSVQSYTELFPWIPYGALISATALIFFQVYGVFKCGAKRHFETIYSVFLSLIFINIITFAATYFYKEFNSSRSIFVLAFALQLLYLSAWKLMVILLYDVLRKPKTAIIIGKNGETEEIARKLIRTNSRSLNVKYICGEISSRVYSLINEVEVVIIGPKLDSKDKESIISHCVGFDKTIFIVPELFEITLFNAKLTQVDDIPVFCIEKLQLSREQRIGKRIMDILISLTGIYLTLPIMIFTYLGIRLYDGGPAIFTQDRVTRGNKEFRLYKFRTMVMNAEKLTGPVLATDKDPRITPLGGFLRATRIDELPQLFNVLFGHMSIVGPRPERQFFIDQFKQYIPDFEYRLAVKAGITGLAQVLGKYTTTPEDKLRYDLLYIRNYSFLLDLRIMLQTIKILFMKASSQGVSEQATFEELAASMHYDLQREVGVIKVEHGKVAGL